MAIPYEPLAHVTGGPDPLTPSASPSKLSVILNNPGVGGLYQGLAGNMQHVPGNQGMGTILHVIDYGHLLPGKWGIEEHPSPATSVDRAAAWAKFQAWLKQNWGSSTFPFNLSNNASQARATGGPDPATMNLPYD